MTVGLESLNNGYELAIGSNKIPVDKYVSSIGAWKVCLKTPAFDKFLDLINFIFFDLCKIGSNLLLSTTLLTMALIAIETDLLNNLIISNIEVSSIPILLKP